MSNSDVTNVRQMFSGLLKHFSQQEDATSDKGQGSSTAGKGAKFSECSSVLDGVLAELQEKKAALRLQRAPRAATAQATSAASEQDLQKAITAIHEAIQKDINALHETLGTGLTPEKLREARSLLLELEDVVSGKLGAGVETRVRAAVIKNVMAQSATVAWSTLLTLMEQKGVAWPAASGLPPWAEEKEVVAANERMVNEIAEAFYSSSPGRVADRMQGIVQVWKANYPDSQSSQWNLLVLQGAGYGILAHIIKEAALHIRDSSEQLKAEAVRMIATEVESVRKAFNEGVSSAHDIDQILGQVSELCEEVIPELAWKSVAAKVDQTAKGIIG